MANNHSLLSVLFYILSRAYCLAGRAAHSHWW
jgi:hypothetical protein